MISLHTYLPEDRRRALARGAILPDRTSGAALFADISGFTPLTEALNSALGPRLGAEELTRYLDAVCTALIAEVERYGGSVVDFAGDAIVCWFDEQDASGTPVQGTAASGLPPASVRAVACARALQQAMAPWATIILSTGLTTSIALKVAVASGPARRFVVGDPEIRWLDVLAGDTVVRMARGEQLAQQGEVVLDAATVEAVGATVAIAEWRQDPETGERFAVVSDWRFTTADFGFSEPPAYAKAHPEIENPKSAIGNLKSELLRPWLHRAVYERATSGQGIMLSEFRPCVALFMRFMGIDYDSAAARPQLDDFVRRIQTIALRHDGTLLQVVIGDKGSYAYIAFGALVSHEDDAGRAVTAALELRAIAGQLNWLQPVQIGLGLGVQYVGTYGSPARRTFSALGAAANVAARLMQAAAPGEILSGERARRAAASRFAFAPRPLAQAKGKADPIAVFAVIGQSQRRAIRLPEPDYALPMVGRQAELQTIAAKLDLALQGQGQVVGIVGEAGLGKSRLVAEVIGLSRRQGFAGYGGACQADGMNTAYLVWRPIWSAFFDAAPALPPPELLHHLEGQVTALALQRANAVPLLRLVLELPAPLPDNEFTRGLDPQARQGALHALLKDCLKAAARAEPLLLVLEDLQWVDALSLDLLEELARATTGCPLCIVLAYRPGQLAPSVAPRLAALPHFTPVALAELTPAEGEQLIRAKVAQLYPWRSGGMPPALGKKLLERAQGNPFYLEELLDYLHDHGLDPYDRATLDQIELPDSLYTLVLSRIDQLPERHKTTLRVASIVGRRFRAAWLPGYYPALGELTQVKSDLDELARLDITPLDPSEPELVYRFKHIVMHEVAYGSLPYAARAQLHEQLAQYLETTCPPASLETLAYHYGRSDNQAKKVEYWQKAGDAARAAFANEAALDYYGQLLPLLTVPTEQIELQLRWGAVLELLGQWERAETHYWDALSRADTQAPSAAALGARSQLALGKLGRLRGDYTAALKWLEQARARWEALGDQAGLSRTLVEIGTVYWRQGDYEVARPYVEEGLALARALGDRPGIAQALDTLGIVTYLLSDYGTARALYEESLALRRELDDKQGIAASLNHLGIAAGDQGDYAAARMLYQESLALRRELGDKWGIAAALNNLAVVAQEQGDYAAARALHEESLVLNREMGNQWGIATSISNLGDVALYQGDYPAARTCYEESLALAQEMGDKRACANDLFGLGLVALAQAETAAARQPIVESLRLRAEIGDKLTIASSLAGLAGVAIAEGAPPRAARLAGAAEALVTSIRTRMEAVVRPMHERTVAAARAALGEEAFNAAWADGEKMTSESLDKAVAYALEGKCGPE